MEGQRTGQPPRSEVVTYDDALVRAFLVATLVFGIVGMLVGVVIALQLAFWPANLGVSWLSFGRLRPLHTNAVVFAFAANAYFAGQYYALQRLLKTRMWSDGLSWFHFWGWQLIIVAAAIMLPLGISQGKEYAELEWPVDIAVAIVWVAMIVNVVMTLTIRRVQHLYVAIWFFLASLITVAMLHVVNALAIPVSLFKSYPIYAGVQDALVQWWYGHNAVGFLLTTPFLGLMYYFVPKAVEKPVYSYRLSIIHFWSLVFIYIWTGPHHLLYTALPEWAQSLGMVFSLMLIAPSWGGMINGLLTMRGAWHKLRTDPILKFFVLALTFYGMATLEGPLMSIKSFNLITHYTDYTIAHVHGGALGWLGGFVFAMAYYLAPRLWNTTLYSTSLANTHFWLATVGLVLYLTSMWSAGITQGLMWFATDDGGLLRYPQFMETVVALQPLYWLRFLGGSLYFVGALICAYVVWKTAQQGQAATTRVTVTPERHVPVATTLHERLESSAVAMGLVAAVLVAIGGIVELVPTFMIQTADASLAESSQDPYSPLQLIGRDLYVREGCANCHSQMVRTYGQEVQRYGRVSEAREFVHDRPFLWGSKRTGPDLHRVGGKYPNLWHYRHMLDPRSTTPGSIMPGYPWLAESRVTMDDARDRLKALQAIGTPYTDRDVEQAPEAARQEAQAIVEDLRTQNVNVEVDREIVAMIAYLQRLGKERQHARTSARP